MIFSLHFFTDFQCVSTLTPLRSNRIFFAFAVPVGQAMPTNL